MSDMTRQEFYNKYKQVIFFFKSYYKYTFTFEGEYNGSKVTIGVGGNSDEIYRMEVTPDCPECIDQLQPFEGVCGNDSFYDY